MVVGNPIVRKADERGRIALGTEYSGKQVEIDVTRSVDVDSLPTMKAVHFLSVSDASTARLYAGVDRADAEALFGIDWSTGPVWERSAFANRDGESAIKDFNAMEKASSGALVCSYYGSKADDVHEADEYNLDDFLIIGVCPPGSKVEAIPLEDEQGNIEYIKTLPLVDTVQVPREKDKYKELFWKNVKGRAVHTSNQLESQIREAYTENRK